ncbi:helix-turn-helix domain-containing protein [Tenacibaculum sp. C7A-26P2]|uniref:helix-turn-helix domain-containing protein n=1 Tax=Tenacibaculum sp. C7A-26P2 TaxID=3447504 RepID=UPI003F866705
MENKNHINTNKNNFLKEQRRLKKLTIYDIALRLSISKQQVISYEKGIDPIPNDIYTKLKKILDL